MSGEIGRRDLIKLGAGAALASAAQAAGKPKFFTPEEYALADELTELIIPADEKSGGARAARVAGFIDSTLAEAFEQPERDRWRQGLKLVNSMAMEAHGGPFLTCTHEQRVAVLTRMADTKGSFFEELKARTIRGYYTSKVGIRDDLEYRGNSYQREEYAGYLPGDSPGSIKEQL
jgi:gluconate 2-dehydrogenase gamma chain